MKRYLGMQLVDMAIVDSEVDSLATLVSAVISISRGLSDDSFLWFRGISCSTHELLPKIMREGKTADQVFERERRLLTRFRQRGLAYWPTGYPQTDWEQLFAMQHYGLPTRLLDWTENLFIAAHFALTKSPIHDHSGSCVPIIYCLDPAAWNRSMPGPSEFGSSTHVFTTVDDLIEGYQPITKRLRSKSPVALFGTHNTQRIVAQRGTFIIWGNDANPLEHFANTSPTIPLLWRLKLTGTKDDLFCDLQSLGFGETMVFPELSSLAEELARTEGWRP